ncbi:hypothetical protein GGS24DRAFT_475116 [Hypoxylon argillaceum]|nr:hypothetical protein GGS24DRAFT_475116 [Hypoxylon argillaceum]
MMNPPRIEIDPLAPPPPRIIEDGSQRRIVGTPRPKGVHTKHLTELERFRVRTLYYDASLSKGRIRQITGYSASQIRTAVRAKSASVGRRPGRPQVPKKGSKASNAKLPTPNGSDASAELLRQAKRYFAREDSLTPGEDDGDVHDRESDDNDEDEDDTPPNAWARTSAPLAPQVPSTALARTTIPARPATPATAPAEPSRQRRPNLSDLPAALRMRIWRSVLAATPPRAWALAVLPGPPWLELGMSPPHVRLEHNPPWAHYVSGRHVPSSALVRVNREARRAVLERGTPVLVSAAVREASRGTPRLVWIDRYSDVVHFFGERFRVEMFEMAGRCACPELYR